MTLRRMAYWHARAVRFHEGRERAIEAYVRRVKAQEQGRIGRR